MKLEVKLELRSEVRSPPRVFIGLAQSQNYRIQPALRGQCKRCNHGYFSYCSLPSTVRADLGYKWLLCDKLTPLKCIEISVTEWYKRSALLKVMGSSRYKCWFIQSVSTIKYRTESRREKTCLMAFANIRFLYSTLPLVSTPKIPRPLLVCEVGEAGLCLTWSNNCLARRKIVITHNKKNVEKKSSFFKLGATLKRKNLLPRGANSCL